MIKVFKNLKKKEWAMMIVAVVFVVLQVWLDLKLPEYTTNITAMFKNGGLTTKAILKQGGYLLLCAVGSACTSVVIGLLAALIGAGLSKTLREKVYSKVQGLSAQEMKSFSTASLITRTTNDIRQVQTIIAIGTQAIVKAPILAIWGITKLISKSWQISLTTFVAVLVISLSLIAIMCFAIPRFKKIQTLYDNINRVTRENLVGARVVRAYNAEEYEQNKFEKANTELTKNNQEVYRIMGLLSPIMSLVMNFLTLAVYVIIAAMINNAGTMAAKSAIISDIWLYTSWTMQIVGAFMMIIMVAMFMPRVLVSVRRINEVLDSKNFIVDGAGANPEVEGEVEFKNVSFSYPDTQEDCLKNISFKCKKGDTVAIIGATGSGKSTLINLIPRFYDVTDGEVLVDGINVKEYKIEDLNNRIGYISQKAVLLKATGSGKSTLINLIPRFYDVTDGEVLVDGINVKEYKIEDLNNRIGYISQKAVLLKGNIKDNISLGYVDGKKVDETSVNEALEVAQAKEFVDGLDDGIEHKISQGATNVSGGQKQRLSIARAISRKPEILIFDDSFSALDYKTDKNLRKSLKKNFDNTTCFIVAQRIGTIKNADMILVLEDGELVGKGTHEELLKNCPVYQEIALSQLNKEELDGKKD